MSFLGAVHAIFIFLKSIWIDDFGYAETGGAAEKRVVLRCEILSLEFSRRVTKRCLRKNSFSHFWFFFQIWQFDFVFRFFDRISSKRFPNPFIVHFGTSHWKFFQLYIRTFPAVFFNSVYLLVTFFVLHYSRFSRWPVTYFTHYFNWLAFKFFHSLKYAKVLFDPFDFSRLRPGLFCFAWSKFLSHLHFQATEMNWWQFTARNQTKNAPKLVSFFHFQ